VRPCACTIAGMVHPQHMRSDNQRPVGCMARLYRRRVERTTSQTSASHERQWTHFRHVWSRFS
jgi:hypothetical protein